MRKLDPMADLGIGLERITQRRVIRFRGSFLPLPFHKRKEVTIGHDRA
ncbi:MAG: hypothetical protein KGY78_07365 [Anaerolineae bacterium]|nr:hypothetical protein [Anaerolineae bacterium]